MQGSYFEGYITSFLSNFKNNWLIELTTKSSFPYGFARLNEISSATINSSLIMDYLWTILWAQVNIKKGY